MRPKPRLRSVTSTHIDSGCDPPTDSREKDNSSYGELKTLVHELCNLVVELGRIKFRRPRLSRTGFSSSISFSDAITVPPLKFVLSNSIRV